MDHVGKSELTDKGSSNRTGMLLAILAVMLFSLATPTTKHFVGIVQPLWVTSSINMGIGLGFLCLVFAGKGFGWTQAGDTGLAGHDWKWLFGTTLLGGIFAPLCITLSLRELPASNVSLYSSLEGVFTVLIAWLAFQETVQRHVWISVGLITLGCLLVYGSQTGGSLVLSSGTLLAIASYALWSLDTNVIHKLSHRNPFYVVGIKSLIAGIIVSSWATVTYQCVPPLTAIWPIAMIGLFGYGFSYMLFLLALRRIGAAKTGTIMALNPFMGFTASVIALKEPVSPLLIGALLLVLAGVSGMVFSSKAKRPAGNELSPNLS